MSMAQAIGGGFGGGGDIALSAQGLTLSWGQGTPLLVVRDVSVAVGAGEVVCLVGRSGCGTTTLVHALS